ncbi:hypothetical protein [Sporosarcina jiandibaonis]|uniref:hypothetical protein n=1 Tax=Sporosarcina jiandibaonis TaxID=2715535 RepID=UPI001557DA9D|nr:hypothetical protein [Sporosarcina jiandibaonis]
MHEDPRPGTSKEKLLKLRPVFKEDLACNLELNIPLEKFSLILMVGQSRTVIQLQRLEVCWLPKQFM